jgi:capsular polysaccharide biosynthesis protein
MCVTVTETSQLGAVESDDRADPWANSNARKFLVSAACSLSSNTLRTGPDELVSARTLSWLAHEPKSAFDWWCYTSTSMSVSGIGNLWVGDQIVTQADLLPNYWHALFYQDRLKSLFDLERERSLPSRVVEEPCIPFTIWGYDTYGHVLIDALPRLLAARKLFGQNIKVLLRTDTPKWVFEICNVFGFEKNSFISFDPRAERIHLASGIFPAYGRQEGRIHPYVAHLFAHSSLPPYAPNRCGSAFLSRCDLPETRKAARNCINEYNLAKIAHDEFGFDIVSPESLSFTDQIKLFRTSRNVAGLIGSALHTSVFSDHKLSIAFVGLNALAQPQICRLANQQYSIYDVDIDVNGAFHVDESHFRRLLQSLNATD